MNWFFSWDGRAYNLIKNAGRILDGKDCIASDARDFIIQEHERV